MKSIIIYLFIVFLSHILVGQGITQHIIKSENLGEERVVSVFLPENYHESNQTYPVLYVLDGEYVSDYAKATADFLSNDFGYLPEIIVVSIPNTDRGRDFYHLLDAPALAYFAAFFEKEVINLIDKNYRSNNFRILYGWSSSSGLSMHLMAKKPDLIKANILSGSGVGPKGQAFIQSNHSNGSLNGTFLYVNCESGIREKGLNNFKNLILELGDDLNQKFEVIETTHVGVLAEGLYRGLNFVFEDYYLTDSLIKNGFEAIIKYYDGLSEMYGFTTQIPAGAINETAGFLIGYEQLDDAQKLLELGTELYPQSHFIYGSLAELFKTRGQLDKAKNCYLDALSKSSDDLVAYTKYKALLEAL
ncbi:alpha/beta hydrolase-fold protein [Ekhidna sp. MALMAid0563]|uniref:alpha/beta hydrolase-fold protein n=1 Tax=Ekhidna sp. MALMAid0563 TaxID=3143937 RepID=UPI0032DEB373